MPNNEFVKMKIGGVYVFARDNAAREAIAALQEAYEALTASNIIVGPLPESGVARTIYRVPGGTTYTDYMWNGSEFVAMATYSIESMESQVGYFVCSTGAGVTAKTVVAQGYMLQTGGCIKIKFDNENTAQAPTLNINSQGAVPIIYGGEAASETNSWKAGETVEIYYDGTNYIAVPIENTLASNLKSWEQRTALSIDSVVSERIRTTAGDESIDSGAGGKLMSIVPKSDFYASAFRETGFNLLQIAEVVGDGVYIETPALPFGSFGTASKPNGVLFTNQNGVNLTPTVRFKAYSDGVPASVNDGVACPYTDSEGYRFYNPAAPGYLIISGITPGETCVHIGWSGRYGEYKGMSDASDAGSTIDLSPIFTWLHSDVNKMLTIGSGSNKIADRADRLNDTQMKCSRYVGLATNLTWTTTADEVEQGAEQTYTHKATISGIKPDGAAEFYGTNEALAVNGNVVSYTDTSNQGTSTYVKYELATIATGNVDVPTVLVLEDWGLEILFGASGEAEINIQYAQGYPDTLAGIAQYRMKDAEERIDAVEVRIGDVEEEIVEDIDFENIPTLCGQPMKLFGNGVPAAATVPDNWIQLSQGGYNWNGTPSAIGQEYIDYSVTSGGHYTAVRDGAYGLKWVNS